MEMCHVPMARSLVFMSQDRGRLLKTPSAKCLSLAPSALLGPAAAPSEGSRFSRRRAFVFQLWLGPASAAFFGGLVQARGACKFM